MRASRGRSAGIDAVRVLGIGAIVAGHVWGRGTPRDLIYAWHVPIFFFISGWLWRDRRNFREEIQRRGTSLLIPYLSWLVLIGVFVLARIEMGFDSEPAGALAKDALLGGGYLMRPFNAFWFVTCLYFSCLLLRCTQRLSLMSLSVGGFTLYLASYPFSSVLAKLPESLGMAIPCIPFMVAGMVGARLAERTPARLLLGAVLLSGCAYLISLKVIKPVDLKVGNLGSFGGGYAVAIVTSFALILVTTELSGAAPAAIAHASTILGSAGFPVVLAHGIVLYLLNTPAGGRFPDFLAALIVPWTLGLVLIRTPLAPLLIGTPMSGNRIKESGRHSQ